MGVTALAASSLAICSGVEVPANGTEILPELILVSRADDERGDRRPLKQPVQGDLRNRLAGLGGQRIEHIDDGEEIVV